MYLQQIATANQPILTIMPDFTLAGRGTGMNAFLLLKGDTQKVTADLIFKKYWQVFGTHLAALKVKFPKCRVSSPTGPT